MGAASSQGGRGKDIALSWVRDLCSVMSPGEVREQLKAKEYSKTRISQLMKRMKEEGLIIDDKQPKRRNRPSSSGGPAPPAAAASEPGAQRQPDGAPAASSSLASRMAARGHAVDLCAPEYTPVPPDGLCLCHVAVAARDVAGWMHQRDHNGWRQDRDLERADTREAKKLLGELIETMVSKGH